VKTGMFVGINTGKYDQFKGRPLFIAKIKDMEKQAAKDKTFTVLWHEPQMRQDKIDSSRKFHRQYFGCTN
jgi:hypothetical protein